MDELAAGGIRAGDQAGIGIVSRAKSLVSWGHDWVVLTLIVAFPAWAPSKVFALPIAMRCTATAKG